MSLKVGLIGAVRTSALTLEALVRHGFEVVGVLGHEPAQVERVSGWADLQALSAQLGLDYQGYQKIGDATHLDWMRSRRPDVIFAVGFSQLLGPEWLNMPPMGIVGFHPTALPEGRGRAPLAWIVHDRLPAAANFFLMGEGADDGPLFVQEVFQPGPDDDAGAVEQLLGEAIDRALDRWLPDLNNGIWNPVPQDEARASWLGKRGPEEGWLDWNRSAEALDRLIKASSRPHPGAYTWFKDRKLVVWKSEIETALRIKGAVGRVLLTHPERGWLLQCGAGLLWLRDLESTAPRLPQVGDKLGLNLEDEIIALKERLLKLEQP